MSASTHTDTILDEFHMILCQPVKIMRSSRIRVVPSLDSCMEAEVPFEIIPPVSPAKTDEFWGLTPEQTRILKQVETLARVLDSAVNVPGLNRRIGVDGLLGLFLPVVGDALAAVASGFIVMQAHKLGLPPAKLAKMVSNILIDTGVGAVPLAGDIFDFAVKANLKNADIIREHFHLPPMRQTWVA